MSIDWTSINNNLPTGRSAEEHAKRREMFDSFKPNSNGLLSVPEVVKGISGVLKLDDSINMDPSISSAFRIAKSSSHSKHECGNEYLEVREFRYFLISLRQYLEYYVAFGRVDTNADKRISPSEFKAAQSKVELWVDKVDCDSASVFKQINTDPDGSISFEEFCSWAIKKNLDLEDDDDNIKQ